MSNNKSSGNDGITKKFYVAFWDYLEIALLLSVHKAFKVGELSTSQKQAVIKLIEKKGHRFIRNDLLRNGDLFLFSTLTENCFQKL